MEGEGRLADLEALASGPQHPSAQAGRARNGIVASTSTSTSETGDGSEIANAYRKRDYRYQRCHRPARRARSGYFRFRARACRACGACGPTIEYCLPYASSGGSGTCSLETEASERLKRQWLTYIACIAQSRRASAIIQEPRDHKCAAATTTAAAAADYRPPANTQPDREKGTPSAIQDSDALRCTEVSSDAGPSSATSAATSDRTACRRRALAAIPRRPAQGARNPCCARADSEICYGWRRVPAEPAVFAAPT